jgi:hypothetical protein
VRFALGELGCLRHVAAGDLEEPHEVVALEALARFLERHERRGIFLEAFCTSDAGMTAVGVSATACSRRFTSWRTLPGHGAATSAAMASGASVGTAFR